MKTRILFILILTLLLGDILLCDTDHRNGNFDLSVLPAKNLFLQSNNVHAVIRTDGILNYDKITLPYFTGGFIWPAAASVRMSMIFASGIWIGAKVILPGNQKDLRVAASFYSSHYSQGNIPLSGSVPPLSVCNDSAFNGYLVSTTDPSLVNGGVRYKNAGGRTFTFVYTSWAAWPVNLGAPFVEVNGLPGYQPGWNSDRPSNGVNDSRPDNMIFSVFMDYTNCTGDLHASELSLPGGSLPLGAEIHQIAYSYQLPGMLNSYLVTYKIINKSGRNWDSTYVSLVNDCDVGDAADDLVGCDSILNLAYTYNSDNEDPVYGTAPPAAGYKVIQGPVVYTGSNSDTAKLPCYSKPRYKMMFMTGHNRFVSGGNECTGDPEHYTNAYNFMRGKDGCGANLYDPVSGRLTQYIFNSNQCNSSDPAAGDKRNLINTGPFSMASGDTQVVTYVYDCERGSNQNLSVCQVKDALQRIASYYYDCSGTIGIEPIGNTIPQNYSLAQNYPNPFNPETSIKFSIPEGNFTSLKIYDILGKEVAVLVNGELIPGNYSISYTASELPSGIYFYRLISGNFAGSKKMMLIR